MEASLPADMGSAGISLFNMSLHQPPPRAINWTSLTTCGQFQTVSLRAGKSWTRQNQVKELSGTAKGGSRDFITSVLFQKWLSETLFSSGEPLKPTKTLRLHWRRFGLLIAVGYCFVPGADRQGAQRALAKETPHVEPDDPDSFIIALLYVDKKQKKKKTHPCTPPDKNSNKWCSRRRNVFGGARASPLSQCCGGRWSQIRGEDAQSHSVACGQRVTSAQSSGARKCQKTLALKNNWQLGWHLTGGCTPFEVT